MSIRDDVFDSGICDWSYNVDCCRDPEYVIHVDVSTMDSPGQSISYYTHPVDVKKVDYSHLSTKELQDISNIIDNELSTKSGDKEHVRFYRL